MLRFGISLIVAGIIALAGYSALGQVTSAPALKTIAVVTARAHHRSASVTVPYARPALL